MGAPANLGNGAPAMSAGKAGRVAFAEALDRIDGVVGPLLGERVALPAGLGRILAEPVYAAADYPAFHVSAMDGYALAASSAADASSDAPVRLALGPAIRAGAVAENCDSGMACPISTGAQIPVGADSVVILEDARLEDSGATLRLDTPVPQDRNVRLQGEDARAGERVMEPGQQITPAATGALSCYGVAEIAVRRRPRIAILSTGDELAGEAGRGTAQIFDSNGPMIEASVRALGLEARRAVAADRIDTLEAMLDALTRDAAPDIIISTGNVSAGSFDLVPDLLVRRGATIHFHGVRMRPGKPVLFASLPNGTLYFGLPGNPVAALLGFRFLVMHAIRRMMGLPRERGRAMSCDEPGRAGLHVFLRVWAGEDGAIAVLPDQRSHTMRSVLDANAWLTIDRSDGDAVRHLFPMQPGLTP